MLQIVDDDEQEPEKRPELFSIELLLDYFIYETSCRNNFDFVQAVIKVFLKVQTSPLLYIFFAINEVVALSRLFRALTKFQYHRPRSKNA